MLALMGASGAGKTTLLDMLSLRKSEGILEGKLLFDGVHPTVADVKRNSSYIQACKQCCESSTIKFAVPAQL